jgi:hypothetical protein
MAADGGRSPASGGVAVDGKRPTGAIGWAPFAATPVG